MHRLLANFCLSFDKGGGKRINRDIDFFFVVCVGEGFIS